MYNDHAVRNWAKVNSAVPWLVFHGSVDKAGGDRAVHVFHAGGDVAGLPRDLTGRLGTKKAKTHKALNKGGVDIPVLFSALQKRHASANPPPWPVFLDYVGPLGCEHTDVRLCHDPPNKAALLSSNSVWLYGGDAAGVTMENRNAAARE